MHDIEEGRLTWADSTQWAINRLSASQIAMANSQVTSQGQYQGQKKVWGVGVVSSEQCV